MKALHTWLILLIPFLSFSQQNSCVSDASLQDSIFNIWTDTIQNLPLAYVNEYFEQCLQIKTPATVGEVIGEPYVIDVLSLPINIAPLDIDSFEIVGIEGLPESISFSLSTYNFGDNNVTSVTFFGTPNSNDVGVYNIEILYDACVSILEISSCLYEVNNEYEKIVGYELIISEYEESENPCDITPSGLFVDNIIHNRVNFNWSQPTTSPSHYMIRYREVGTSSWTVMTAGPVNSNEFTGTSRTRYFMEPGTNYEWNIRARVLNEDGSTNCQSPWSASSQYTTLEACANLENLSASTEANWVTLSADAPDASWGVWQSKGKVRVVGTNSFRYLNGNANGDINVLKGNFTANTDYEWHTKAWCTGNVDELGNSDPQYHSGWGAFSSFTTEETCDKMPINLTTSSNGANTAITMNWDLPLSGIPDHYFLELTNETTGQVWAWNNIAGNQTSKTKFGLSIGNYSWRIRGACGENSTSWATIFTQPVYYTLGGERLENEIVSDLNIYPNPSSNIFNLEFNIGTEAEILVTNILGEQVYFESTQSVGELNTQIDLSDYSNGIYNLTIKTSDGISNHKLILQ